MTTRTVGRAAACIVAGVALATAACKPIAQRQALKDCKFKLTDVDVKGLSLTNVILLAKVEVYNPNDLDVIVDRFDYELFSDKVLLAAGTHAQQEKIAKGATDVVEITVNSPLKNLGKGILNQITNRNNVTYTLRGTVYVKTFVGDLKIPVTLQKKY